MQRGAVRSHVTSSGCALFDHEASGASLPAQRRAYLSSSSGDKGLRRYGEDSCSGPPPQTGSSLRRSFDITFRDGRALLLERRSIFRMSLCQALGCVIRCSQIDGPGPQRTRTSCTVRTSIGTRAEIIYAARVSTSVRSGRAPLRFIWRCGRARCCGATPLEPAPPCTAGRVPGACQSSGPAHSVSRHLLAEQAHG